MMSMWTTLRIFTAACFLRLTAASCYDPSCKFVYDPEEPSTAVFDLTPVCLEAQNADFSHNDILGFMYYAQVCGGIDVREHCNPPDRTPEYHKGTAMQLWGNVFHCPSGDCDTNCSTLANCTGDNCCTAKCEVLAIGTPTWSLADSTNVHTGGLIATFPPIQRSSNGSLQCLHGSQTVQYHFHCDWDLEASRLGAVTVSGNGRDACLFKFDFYSKYACIRPVVSPGWVILGCTLILWGSYVTLGMAWMMLKHGRFDYAHRDEWKLWLDDVKLGAKFLTSQLPCQRKYEHIQ